MRQACAELKGNFLRSVTVPVIVFHGEMEVVAPIRCLPFDVARHAAITSQDCIGNRIWYPGDWCAIFKRRGVPIVHFGFGAIF